MTHAHLPSLDLDAYLKTLPGRCSGCGYHTSQGCHCNVAPIAPTALRDAGQSAASSAHPDERAAVEAAIRQLAATGREFSSNEARPIHGVTGPVVGAAFTAARKAGLIRAVGFVTSTDPGTHAHPVRTWIGVNTSGVAA